MTAEMTEVRTADGRLTGRIYREESGRVWTADVWLLDKSAEEIDAMFDAVDRQVRIARRDPLLFPRCAECGRVFDLTDDTDAAEWSTGHDCEWVEADKCVCGHFRDEHRNGRGYCHRCPGDGGSRDCRAYSERE